MEEVEQDGPETYNHRQHRHSQNDKQTASDPTIHHTERPELYSPPLPSPEPLRQVSPPPSSTPPPDVLAVPGPMYRDPWAAREAWRKSPIFSNRAMFRNMFPGLGIAIVAFTGYVIYDDFIAAKPVHGHGETPAHH